MELETTSSFKPEIYRDQIVESLRHSMAEGEHGLSAVPNLIKRAEEAEVWRERVVRVTGEVVEKNSFVELVEAMPPDGLGATVDLLKGLCRDDPEALAAIRRMTKGKGGRPPKTPGDSRSKHTPQNDKAHWLERLERERSDLYQRVTKGELSANAAAIEAGFRKKTITVPLDLRPAARRLVKHFDRDELIKAIREA